MHPEEATLDPSSPYYRPFSEACENNKAPILTVLKEVLGDCHRVLEIGSGTGQHAVHFAKHLPHLSWQPTDLADSLPGIQSWMKYAGLDNILPPIELDVVTPHWPLGRYCAAFSANTSHIMGWPEVERMFEGLAQHLEACAPFALYGPFNYHGEYTAESNQRFDRWLRARNPVSGLKDLEQLLALAARTGFRLDDDYEMPANNRLLVWRLEAQR